MSVGRPEADATILRIEDASVDFFVRSSLWKSRPVHAVRGVSLDMTRGETVALVGESGSGKTTLGRATLRLVPLTGGRVVFEGADVGSLAGRALLGFRQRAQVIFQDPFSSLSPFMRVGQIVEEPLTIHGPSDAAERRRRVLAALEQVKLRPATEMAEKFPHTLSGGQRQRVSIARAMVLRPEYLVADEPVSMIDASSRAEILDLLDELQAKQDLTILYITHDLASARHFAERIAVMYAGRLVELGPTEAVIDRPAHPYTAALLTSTVLGSAFGQRLEVIPGMPPDLRALPDGCSFAPRCRYCEDPCRLAMPPEHVVAPAHMTRCRRVAAREIDLAGPTLSTRSHAGRQP
jgi:oligopeptide/dipeptide ABC transporter ATP-binding protein